MRQTSQLSTTYSGVSPITSNNDVRDALSEACRLRSAMDAVALAAIKTTSFRVLFFGAELIVNVLRWCHTEHPAGQCVFELQLLKCGSPKNREVDPQGHIVALECQINSFVINEHRKDKTVEESDSIVQTGTNIPRHSVMTKDKLCFLCRKVTQARGRTLASIASCCRHGHVETVEVHVRKATL